MGWGLMRKLLSDQEVEDTVVSPMHVIQEKTASPCRSEKCDTRELKPPCRTPMGEYIVPQGGKPLTSLGDSCPGPADYLPKVDPTKGAAAQYSIVGRPKIIDEKRCIPGPFEYNTSGDIKWKKKKVTLKGRGKSYFDEQAEKSISVLGKYNVKHQSFGKEGSKFKMGSKAGSYTGPSNSLVQPVDTKGFQTPGPNYRPNSGYWGRGPKKSFGKTQSTREPQGPGPGDYDVQHTNRGPSHSFGIKLPEPVAVQKGINKFSPAANTYDIGTTIGKAPAVSIAGRYKEPKEARKGPCPSAYYVDRKYFDKYKATSLTYRWFDTDEAPRQPGPADHNVKHVNLKSNPSYTCRERVKTSYPDKDVDDNPGPGAYNHAKDFVNNDNPAFSFRKRLEPVVGNKHFPGPNSYEVEKQEKPGSKRAPAFSMAKRLDPPNSIKNNPGPGEYYPNFAKTDRGKYTMTKRPKGKGTFVNPAPNLYTLPEAISGKKKGVVFKSRASPYVYSGYRTTKLEEPRNLAVITN